MPAIMWFIWEGWPTGISIFRQHWGWGGWFLLPFDQEENAAKRRCEASSHEDPTSPG